jgi:hypothetical protein
MLAQNSLSVAQFWVSLGGLLLTLVAGLVALQSFLRSEKWKKAEFLAKEMKDFFEDKSVQKTLRLIDWGLRRVQLLPRESKDSGVVVVTRALQVTALRPHCFMKDCEMAELNCGAASADEGSGGAYLERFRPEEVAIRDCYDRFLDGLEKFSSYVDAGLVQATALRPYIGYWVDNIHASANNKDDAAWKAALLTYISYYRFEGVLSLFKAFGRDIAPASDAYKGFLRQMSNRDYATKLAEISDQKLRN